MDKLLLFLLAISSTTAFGQSQSLVVLDGFFIKQNKEEVISFLGAENIKDTTFIAPDSAMQIVEEHGINGLFIVNTYDEKGDLSYKLREQLYFDKPPHLIIDFYSRPISDLKNIDKKDVDSLRIIPPFTTVLRNGLNHAGGAIIIITKSYAKQREITEPLSEDLTTDTAFVITDNYVKLPSFEVELRLSKMAEKKLKKSKESIIVQAYFRGIPKDKTNEEFVEWGKWEFGEFSIELTSERVATFNNATVSRRNFDALDDSNFEVLINIFSGRKSSQFNLLNVDSLQEPIDDIKGKRHVLIGTLIDEM